jgi:ribosome-binding factor A
MNYRRLRLEKTIREELGRLIRRYVEVPHALITVTEVEVNEKLEEATIHASVLPSEAGGAALKALEEAEGKLRRELAKKIRIFSLPKFRFVVDREPEKTG